MLYDWWLSALEVAGDYGVLTREQMATLGVHEGEPQCGFYRIPTPRNSDEPEAFVAIWRTAGRFYALRDGATVDPFDVWSWCCRYPISEDRYRRMERCGFAPLGIFGSLIRASG